MMNELLEIQESNAGEPGGAGRGSILMKRHTLVLVQSVRVCGVSCTTVYCLLRPVGLSCGWEIAGGRVRNEWCNAFELQSAHTYRYLFGGRIGG